MARCVARPRMMRSRSGGLQVHWYGPWPMLMPYQFLIDLDTICVTPITRQLRLQWSVELQNRPACRAT